MKHVLQNILKSILIIGCISIYGKATSQTNLALTDETMVSTSFVSPWETLSAVNDNNPVIDSWNRTYPIYGNWNGEGDYGNNNWVEYSWDFAHAISSVSVYWFTDGGGLLIPNTAYIEYWNGLDWVFAGNIGILSNTFNTLENLDISASKIRVNMSSNTSTGIVEFQVFGTETTQCDQTEINPSISVNNADPEEVNYVIISPNDSVQFTPTFINTSPTGSMQWTGPDNFSSGNLSVNLSNLTEENSGTYFYTYVNPCGVTTTLYFHLTVLDNMNSFNSWPEYDTTLYYDFSEDYPNFPEPTLNLEEDYPGYSGCNADWTQDYGSWTFVAGPQANALVTPAAVNGLLQRLDSDFRYLRDNMGWPPDKLFREGYRSSVYLFGSGLCTDTAANDVGGGWQGAVTTQDGEVWPMLILSYYPVSRFEPQNTYGDAGYQQGACVHEGIHAIYASLPGCRDAAWFHEGSNVWLQTVLELKKSGTTNYDNVDLGWLSMGSVMAPFLPIECYSGWLTDGSFGGPGAQGVFTGVQDPNGNYYDQTRAVMGGVQYSTIFPTFLGEIVGEKSLPWVWNYAIGNVLEGIANGDGTVNGIGDYNTRKMIQEYRARLALADFERFTQPILNLYNNWMGAEIDEENNAIRDVETWVATPYAITSEDAEGYLIPDELTLPGWSGANIVPIHVSGDQATVTFEPLGPNMSMQLCYRTASGNTFYSPAIFGGEASISFQQGAPANNVIFAVVSNTDYIYEGEHTRTTKFNYRLMLGAGAVQAADVHLNWWDWTSTIVDQSLSVNSNELLLDSKFIVYPNPTLQGTNITIKAVNNDFSDFDIALYQLNGQMVYSKQKCLEETISIPTQLEEGIYILRIDSNNHRQFEKLMITK